MIIFQCHQIGLMKHTTLISIIICKMKLQTLNLEIVDKIKSYKATLIQWDAIIIIIIYRNKMTTANQKCIIFSHSIYHISFGECTIFYLFERFITLSLPFVTQVCINIKILYSYLTVM